MKYTVEKQKGQVLISIELNAQDWENAIEKAYQANKGEYSQPGFRKGHVPRKVLESFYGKSLFHEDALNEAITKYYYEILDKETDIYPVDRPEIDIQELGDDGVKMTALVVTKPEVKLGKYKGLKIKKTVAEVEEKDIVAELEKIAEKSARMVKVEDRALMTGDEATFDFSGSVNGVKFDGGTAENYKLVIGSGKFIPGFEEQMVGMPIGGEKDVNVKFPEDYHSEELKGKDAVFAVKLHEIHKKELPAIDDELAKDVTEFDSLADWKADVKKNLTKSNEERADQALENEIVDAIVKAAEVDIPSVMIETQIDNYMKEFETTLSYQGLKLEDYVKYTNSTVEQMREMYKSRSEATVKTRLVMEEIVNQEKLFPEKSDIDAHFEEIAAQTGQTIDEFSKTVDEQQVNYILNDVASKKLVEFLKKENSIV